MISVLDYGAGNIGSVIRMFERAGGEAQRISTVEEITESKKLVIPGVGAFDFGMSHLISRGLLPALNSAAIQRRIPILGICLGMQLMCRSSSEGTQPGLGWIDAESRQFKFESSSGLHVPHMGWNTIRVVQSNPIIASTVDEQRFYFVHSYRVMCNDPSDPIAFTHYGEDFVAAFQRNNLFGVQFHPEKSHRFGTDLMRRFLEFEFAQA
jgi:glutamine amidotransferase